MLLFAIEQFFVVDLLKSFALCQLFQVPTLVNSDCYRLKLLRFENRYCHDSLFWTPGLPEGVL